jgi:hypothetical protein
METNKPRCQAILLMPRSREWADYIGQSIRCKWAAKPDSPFCGVHKDLSQFIVEIVWKD